MNQEKMMEMMQNAMNGNPEAVMALMAGLAGMANGDGKVYNPEVDRVGDKVIIPEGAYLPNVIDALKRQYRREEQETTIHVTLPVAPWDGALALMKAIERNLGVFIQNEGCCGGGADQLDVEVELGETISVPWGNFELPGMEEAQVYTDTTSEGGRVVFQCHVECKRKFEDRVRRLLDTAREIALKESMHRGKSFSIAFRDDDGDRVRMPKPKFFEFLDETPIFRRDLTEAIERNVFVPIRHAKELQEMGESLKRGVLFAGNFGVGKTMLASHIARVANEFGWTFIYVKDAEELPEALCYAQQYQPVVVFAEDVDRVAGIKRTKKVNELLNQLDGVDSKSAKIMTILTSNHPEQINAAMLRPGRVDLALQVLPPDAETVESMVRHYAGNSLKTKTDLSKVAEIMANETPARVREAIGRAKLESLRRTGKPNAKLTAADLEAVAHEVKAEGKFLAPDIEKKDQNHLVMMGHAFTGIGKAMRSVGDNGAGHSHQHMDA